MAKNESDLIAEFKDAFQDELLELELPIGYWRKIHGELYMAGMPDVLCAKSDRAAMAEFKWVRDAHEAKMPLGELLAQRITGRQAFDLGLLATLDGPLRSRVVIGMPVEFMSHGVERSGVVAVGVDYQIARSVTQSLAALALILIAAKTDPLKINSWAQWPAHVEGQLRVERGERWRASAITLGLQSYVPQLGGGVRG